MQQRALERYKCAKVSVIPSHPLIPVCTCHRDLDPEIMVSGSDDFTLFLWQPSENKKPIARMTGWLVA